MKEEKYRRRTEKKKDEGRGCVACYQMKCRENVECSGNPITVVTTDECKTCSSDKDHFDLSGTAFGALAKPGKADNLRQAGRLQVKYTRVACQFGTNIALKVDSGSNPYYFSLVIEYENDNSNLAAVHLKQAQPSDSWVSMKRDRGAVWILNSSSPLRAPLSVKPAEASGETIVAENVIPVDWKPRNTYHSLVKFKNSV
ncbi:hypothetical protein L6164_013543 [Bauhinia variegata]|uniref:Uncharacterized protein n=1 Tax=Bauhinia variegata TaxID=167791 RepID=A0ACB9NGI9_BAUVA|nr:hypothetical protein L6164_013543 [Bauhinia variegata]